MVCKHKNKLSLYGRGESSWYSTQIICGDMIYACRDCGEVLSLQPMKIKSIKSKPGLAERTKDALEVQDD